MIPRHADLDHRFMEVALRLAHRGLGNVAPNPAVGCVIVDRDQNLVGRGWTAPSGRPHAETQALERAGARTKGATAYMTLEPCAHHGRTPPCAEALVRAGLARAVVSIEDPDPRVSGRGIEKLRAAGIEVTVGVGEAAAAEVNAGYLQRLRSGRPLVTLKMAASLDGRIATHHRESRWISGEAAREHAHLLRAQHDAIMVGIGTALTDNPELTCRLPGLENRTPLRVIADSWLRLPLTAKVIRTARQHPTAILTRADNPPSRRKAFLDCGVDLVETPVNAVNAMDLKEGLKGLADLGITRLLVEGGATLAASLLREKLVDRVVWYRAPRLIGGDGVPAIQGFGLEKLSDGPQLRLVTQRHLGRDLLEVYALEA